MCHAQCAHGHLRLRPRHTNADAASNARPDDNCATNNDDDDDGSGDHDCCNNDCAADVYQGAAANTGQLRLVQWLARLEVLAERVQRILRRARRQAARRCRWRRPRRLGA
jgi:hypothetical protein